MKLELLNFKCFPSAVFEFSANCTLISGVSGSGKTSILSAIFFAVTGLCKKPVSFGKTRCRVRLWYYNDDNKLKIERTKGPERLVVTINNKSFEGSEAQSVINHNLPDWELGYVTQRLYKSFITTSSADKLDVIEKMSFVGLDIAAINTRSKNLISERKIKLQSIVSEKTSLESILKDIGVLESVPESSTELNLKLRTLLTDKDTITKQIQQLQQIVANERVQRERESDQRIRIESLRKRLQTIGTKTIKQSCINRLQDQTNRYNSYLAAKKQLNESIEYSEIRETEINLMIEDMKTIKSICAAIKSLSTCSKELKDAEAFKESHVVQVGACPSCGTEIGSWNGKLVLPTKSMQYTTVKESEQCEHNRTLLLEAVARLEKLKNQKREIQKLYSTDLNVEQQLSYLYQIKANDRIWERCNELKCDKPTENVQKLIEQMKEQKLLVAELDTLESLYQLNNQTNYNVIINTAESDLIHKTGTLKSIEESIESVKESIKNSVFALKWKRVEELKNSEKLAEAELQSAVKLSALIKTAERLALIETLANINLRVKIYIDKFFDTNLVVNLVFEDKLKPKIELCVIQNSEQTTIDSLSGGEFARVVLAFTLAMAEVNNLNFLMLDESFASLDAEATLKVLEAIKENFSGMVIVVAHQMVKGVFESVVEL